MPGFIDRLLGKGDGKPSRAAASDAPPVAACDAAAHPAQVSAATPATADFISREAILDRDERISGYQFSMPEEIERRLADEFEFLPKVYDDAVLRGLAELGLESLLGPRLAFVRISPASLDNPRLRQLPAKNTVVMVSPVHLNFDGETVGRQLAALRQAGYMHGWLLRQAQLQKMPELVGQAAQADYIQLDAAGFDGMEARVTLTAAQRQRQKGLPRPHFVAGGLGAYDEFNLYFSFGFHYFFGDFVTRREHWKPPRSKINRLHVMRLLNMLRSEVDIEVLAEELRHDPVMAFKLLRYINSPVIGLQTPVTSLDKALLVLGRDKFYRWLSLLLFDFKMPGYNERVLIEQALSRGRLLETLAGHGRIPGNPDQMFILGLFSVLDLLMNQSMSRVLVETKLPESLQEALLGQPGPHLEALKLALVAEGRSGSAVESQAEACGLDARLVSEQAVRALAWAHEIATVDIGDEES